MQLAFHDGLRARDVARVRRAVTWRPLDCHRDAEPAGCGPLSLSCGIPGV